MSTDPSFQPGEIKPIRPAPVAPPITATGVAWGNSAPLALAGFGVTAFMLAMI
jgi:succinate-acetate transporter protein